MKEYMNAIVEIISLDQVDIVTASKIDVLGIGDGDANEFPA